MKNNNYSCYLLGDLKALMIKKLLITLSVILTLFLSSPLYATLSRKVCKLKSLGFDFII